MVLFVSTPDYSIYIKRLATQGRECEKITVGEMINQLFEGRALKHRESGAPYVEGSEKYISVSHGGGYAVVAVGNLPLGVDIEAPRTQLERIKCKFMRNDDRAESLLHAWTAKEAAFKVAGESQLTVHDIKVNGNTAFLPGYGSKTIDFYRLGNLLIALAC